MWQQNWAAARQPSYGSQSRIRPGQPSSLNIETPGVYPLLINVNGTPDYGSPARLDQRRFLLPVTGVPADTGSGNPLADVVAPDTAKPVGVTMLWPLADKPRLAPACRAARLRSG